MTRWTRTPPDPIAVKLDSSLTPSLPSNIVPRSRFVTTPSLPRDSAEDEGSDSDSASDNDSEDSDSDNDSEDSDSDSDDEDSGDEDSEHDSDSSNQSSDDDSDSEDEFASDLSSTETISVFPQDQLSGTPTATLSNSTVSPPMPPSHTGNGPTGPGTSPSPPPRMSTSSSPVPKGTEGSPSPGSSSLPPKITEGSISTAPKSIQGSSPPVSSSIHAAPDSENKSVSHTSSPPSGPSPGTSSSHSGASSSDPQQLPKQTQGMSASPSNMSTATSSPSHSASVNAINSTASAHNSTAITSHSVTSSVNSISSTIPSHSVLNEPQGIVSTGPEATTVPNNHESHGFFSDHSLVAGVFVAVTVVILIILGLLPWFIARCRRCKRNEYQAANLTVSQPNPFPYDNEVHHKRASQIRAFSDILSAGASRPVSDASDGSHTPTHDSHHSSALMIQRRTSKSFHPVALLPSYPNVHTNFTSYHGDKLPLFDLPNLPRNTGVYRVDPIDFITRENDLYQGIVHDPKMYDNFYNEEKTHTRPKSLRTVPLLGLTRLGEDPLPSEAPHNSALLTPPQSGRPIIPPRNPRRLTITPAILESPPKIFPNPFSNQSQHSVAQSSPSIYPPTLPGEAEDEYWKQQGFENVDFSSSDKPAHRSVPRQQPTPESPLGLQLTHDNSSDTTIQGHDRRRENGQKVNDMQTQYGGVHGRTASMPSNPLVSEGRYPLLTIKTMRL